MTEYTYIGCELELFSHASNWKTYQARLIRPYLGNEVLEVGAGIGATTTLLYSGNQKRWVCLEPDLAHARTLAARIAKGHLPGCCEVRVEPCRS